MSEDVVKKSEDKKSDDKKKLDKKSLAKKGGHRGSKDKKNKKKIKKSLKKRYQQGFKKGFKKGIELGIIRKSEEVAKILLIRDFDLDLISRVTGLANEDLTRLKNQ